MSYLKDLGASPQSACLSLQDDSGSAADNKSCRKMHCGVKSLQSSLPAHLLRETGCTVGLDLRLKQ